MIYRINEEVNAEKIATLREAVGWNRMENELRN